MDETERRGWSRETKIRRDAAGRWYEDGVPIDHPGIQRAFDRWIDRAEDGRYVLRNDVNWAYIEIDGAPIFVRHASTSGSEVLLGLSDGTKEKLDRETLRQGRDGALYCQVRAGRLAARFDRAAAMELSDLIGEDERGVYLRLEGERVRPPVVEEPLRSHARPRGR